MASVLVPLAQGCEELEAVTVIDLLRRAGIEVTSAGLDDGPVRASRGTVLVPDTTLDAVMDRDFDMIVLPGGLPGADHLEQDTRIQALLRRMADADRYTAAICAAPKVPAQRHGHGAHLRHSRQRPGRPAAGLLAGRRATSYPGVLDNLQVEGLQVVDQPVVEDDRIITSRGPGTAMDFALTLIEKLAGRARRDEVEAALQRP